MGWFDRLFGRSPVEGLVPISPAAKAARIAALLPNGPSVDDRARMPVAQPSLQEAAPYSALDWYIDVPPSAVGPKTRATLGVACPGAGIFAGADGGFVLAVRLLLVKGDQRFQPGRQALESLLAAAQSAASGPVTIREPIEVALARQAVLVQCWQPATARATAILRRPDGFDGKAVFDAMLSLGYDWGELDWFRWYFDPNTPLVTVSTTTPPGYFLPEAASAGTLRPLDLVLNSALLALSPPGGVAYDGLVTTAQYLRERLGGTLVGEDGTPLDVEGDRKTLATFEAKLTAIGLIPGSAAARSFVS